MRVCVVHSEFSFSPHKHPPCLHTAHTPSCAIPTTQDPRGNFPILSSAESVTRLRPEREPEREPVSQDSDHVSGMSGPRCYNTRLSLGEHAILSSVNSARGHGLAGPGGSTSHPQESVAISEVPQSLRTGQITQLWLLLASLVQSSPASRQPRPPPGLLVPRTQGSGRCPRQ